MKPDIKKLYYDVVRFYELPVINHAVLGKKIVALEREVGSARAAHYLGMLIKRDLRTENFGFKPTLNTGLDIYMKRVQIERYYTTNNPRQSWLLPTPEQQALEEERRKSQWEQ